MSVVWQRQQQDVSGLPLAIYTRLSRVKKPSKRAREHAARRHREWQTITVRRQERICREWATRARVAVWPEVFCDNNLSAWLPDRKRPRWDELNVLLQSGQVGGVLVFDADRFCRRNFDLEVFLAITDRFSGMQLASPMVSFDLDSEDAQDMLRMRIQMANREVAQTRKRILVALEERARDGVPHSSGTRCFGFTDSVSNTHVPAEAEVIRQTTTRLLRGDSLYQVVWDLEQAGVRTVVKGVPFTSRTLKTTLLKPRNAGLVYYHGQCVARMDGDPVVPEQQWRDLVALFDARRAGRPARGAYLLTGLCLCARCGRRMSGNTTGAGGVRIYQCKTRKTDFRARGCSLAVHAADLETDAETAILAWLSDPARSKRLAQLTAAADDQAAAALTALTRAKTSLADLYEKHALGQIPEDVFHPTRDRLTELLARNQATLDAVQAPAHVAALTTENAHALWEQADPMQRRELARAAISKVSVGEHPDNPRRRAYTHDRITYTFN